MTKDFGRRSLPHATPPDEFVRVQGACEHNLKNIDVCKHTLDEWPQAL